MSLSGLESDSNSLSSSDRDVSSVSKDDDHYSDGSEDDGADAEAATAKPPDGASVSSSSVLAVDVLDLLDQLVEKNKISNERAARLKHKYNALKSSIDSSRAAENALLHASRELQQQLASGSIILEKAEGFPEADCSEASRLRQIILQHENELKQSEERIAKLDREIESLQEECMQVQKEYNHMPKPEEDKKKAELLMREIQRLQDEIGMKSSDIIKMKGNIVKKEDDIDTLQKDAQDIINMEDVMQDELAAVTIGPANIPREIDRIMKNTREAESQIEEAEAKLDELDVEQLRKTEQCHNLREQFAALQTEVANNKRANDMAQASLESLDKNINILKDREATCLEEGAAIELQLKHRTNEYKALYETLSSKAREKDKELKALKRAEIQLKSAEGAVEQMERQMEPLVLKSTEFRKKKQQKDAITTDLSNEVDLLRKTLAQREGQEQVIHLVANSKVEKEKSLRDLSKRHHEVIREIGKHIVGMIRQRDNRARDYYKALREERDAYDEFRRKKSQIDDQCKKLKELEMELEDFAQAYDLVKTERNKTYSQIQTCQQLSAEMREKIKVLQNEMEILQNSVDSKTKVFNRAHLALLSKNQDRDMLHQDLSQIKMKQDNHRGELEGQREHLSKLTQQIAQMEQSLERLRRHYEQAVQDRNDTGLQLIERNEEVCVFHEKINVQQSISLSGKMALLEKDEEIQFLKMEIAKLEREVGIGRKKAQDEYVTSTELQSHRNELHLTRENIKRLEREVTDANNPERINLLQGKDPSCAELRAKIEKLQAQLTNCEQKVLEKELLLEQVARLTERTNRKAEARKETTLQVGNKVNNYQSRLREASRKMMAISSELVTQQALSMRLQQEIEEKEGHLEQAYSRLEAGEAPDDEIAKEWIRILQKRAQKSTDVHHELSMEMREIENGVYTTAEQRPNAYLPDNEIDLPIPKPYGGHAPFKPSIQGSNMRHIRKPQLPPIDI